MANLGQLTLDLVAKIGGFTGPLDKAARDAKKHMLGIESATKGASKSLSDMKAHAHGAMGGMTDFEKSLMGVQMRLMNVSMAAALVSLPLISVTQAALLSEKNMRLFSAAVGDAALSAKELEYVRQLSHDLGLEITTTTMSYGKFMAAIRGSSIEGEQGRKVFEAVSSAATALGLSADEAHGMFNALQQMMSKGKVQAEELRGQLGERLPGALNMAAKAMGVTTAELYKMMEDGKLFADDLLPKLAVELDKTYGGAAKEGAKSAAAEINRFNNAMMETKAVAGKALLPVFTDILKAANPAILSLVKVTQAVQILGIRLAANAAKRGVAWDNLISGKGMFSKEGVEIQKKADDEADKLADEMIENILKGSNASTSAYNDEEKAATAATAAKQKAAAAAAVASASAAADAKKRKTAAEALTKAINGQVTALELQAEVLGWSEDNIKLYELAQKGATVEQLESAKAALDTVAAFKSEQDAMAKVLESAQAYSDLVNDLMTDEEKWIALTKQRIAVMQQAGIDPNSDIAGKIAASGVTKAPSFGGVAPEIGGINGEISKVDQAKAELEAWKNAQIERQMIAQDLAGAETELFYASEEAKFKIYEEFNKKKGELDKTRQALVTQGMWESISKETSIMSDAFSSLSEMTKNFAGENSAIYKAMFAVQKVFAAAMIIANTELAASQALATTGSIFSGLTLSQIIRVSGYASAGMVAGMGLAGMAHDGMDSIPQDGTWLLKKGERVSTAETSAKLDKTLDSVSQQSRGGDAPIVNLYEDKSKAGQVESRTHDDRRIIDIFVADLMGDGRAQKAMSRKFGLQTVGA